MIATARLALVMVMAWSLPVGAQPLPGVQPGVTTMQELVRQFGRPTQRQTLGGEGMVLSYQRAAAPKGTLGVVFRVDAQGLLQRVDVSPKDAMTRADLESTYGPACTEDTPARTACYQSEPTLERDPILRYTSLGLVVRFKDKRVTTLTSVRPPSAPAAHLPVVEATPLPAPRSAPLEPGTPETSLAPATIEDPIAPAVVETPDAPSPAPTPGTDALRRNILSLGGTFYQRGELSVSRLGTDTHAQPQLPAIVDLYLDGAPREWLRAFLDGRLAYDPVDKVLSSPRGVLNQLWLRFDFFNRVFVTLGRQQFKWGSSQIWNPTDFLQSPNPQPLEAFDLRTGIDMLKVNIPFETLSSNLWLIATADLTGPADNPLRYGGAVRAEAAIGQSELAAMAYFKQGRRPRYGLDWSMGAGPVDLNAELALLHDSDVGLWQRSGTGFVPRTLQGPLWQASGGLSTQARLADEYRLGARVEGFYNSLGYDDPGALTWVQSTGDYRALFFGRAYAMGQVSITRRSIHVPTLTVTGLMNLTDRSLISRLDFLVVPINEMKVYLYLEAPFGALGSEFRFKPDPAIADLPDTGQGVLRVGFNLRMRI